MPILKIGGIALVLLILGLFVFQQPLKEAAMERVTRDMFVERDSDRFDPGAEVGELLPPVTARLGEREVFSLREFFGPNGLVFVATRSADWCPYCMKQMIKLQEHKVEFDAAGIGIVAMTYDDPELQRAFVEKHGIEYPLLQDVDTLTFQALGIFNFDYQPGDPAYGIPHPGMFVLNPEGQIVGKLFLQDYSVRVSAEASLDYAKRALGLDP